MKSILMFGVALLVMGAAILGYDHFSYTTTDQVFQIGTLTATAEQPHAVALSPILGWLLVGAGACALVFSVWAKKD